MLSWLQSIRTQSVSGVAIYAYDTFCLCSDGGGGYGDGGEMKTELQ